MLKSKSSMKIAAVIFLLLDSTYGWRAHTQGEGLYDKDYLVDFEEFIDYDDLPSSNYTLETIKEALIFYGVGLQNVDWRDKRYYIVSCLRFFSYL